MRRFFLVVLFFLLLLCGCAAEPYLPSVAVMLTESGGFSVEGENPVHVRPGEDAVFHVTLDPSAVFLRTDGGAEYDEKAGTLTLRNVRYPSTVSLQAAVDPVKVKYFVEGINQGGRVETDIPQGFIWDGTVVHVNALPKENFRFEGWSLKYSLEKGGEFLTAQPQFTYTVQGDTFLVANFIRIRPDVEVPKDDGLPKILFNYHTNGGVYAGTEMTLYPHTVSKHHIYQNCLPGKGYFTRDGYQLIEYNTRPDGSGNAYSLGSKITEEGDTVDLYCIWAKETDASAFTWVEDGIGTCITSYTGTDKTVVIPEKLGGKAVIRVAAGAFRDAPFETLVIPRTMQVVEAGAFGCTAAFTTLYMPDGIKSIPDDAFTNTEGLRNYRLNAVRDPAYTNSTEGNYVVKWERLVSEKGPKLILVAGSSAFYGLNSPMMEELLGGKYAVVNYGTNVSSCGMFYLEALLPYIGKDDIVIHAPEYLDSTRGSTELSWKQYQATEYYYNIWRDVNIGNYTKIFSSLTEFNQYRGSKSYDYTATASNINKWGDRTLQYKYNPDNYHSGTTQIIKMPEEKYSSALRAMYDRLKATGAVVAASCPPTNVNAVPTEYRDKEVLDAYVEEYTRMTGVPMITHPSDTIMEGRMMSNYDLHPNAYGRDIHTRQLYKDLAAYMGW